ncbi:MAG: glutamate--cysteine ligase [Bdellovibrionales bacterium]|nr:glutamate--cysteine ligase [Bdellovibrionales bacterium]
MIQDVIHKSIVSNIDAVNDWFKQKGNQLKFPIYSSYDIRDSGYKVAPVDANIYPAGFNNICQIDYEGAVQIFKRYMDKKYPGVNHIALLAEEHTKNPYYWDNISKILGIIKGADKKACVGWAKDMTEDFVAENSIGEEIVVHPIKRQGNKITMHGHQVDFIVSNNDFSVSYDGYFKGAEVIVDPFYELGWFRRRKHDFFRHYNTLVEEFCKVIDLDPWLMSVETSLFENFDLNDQETLHRLAHEVDVLLKKQKEKFIQYDRSEDPFVIIKNNSGTYGLAVLTVNSAEEVLAFNNKARKKMKATKGGGGVNQVVIQEGIPTRLISEEETAEPALYMIGDELAGGFLRAHKQKGPNESLNSPGAIYKRLCVSDLKINVEGYPLENVYGWLAKLGVLAIGKEIDQFSL